MRVLYAMLCIWLWTLLLQRVIEAGITISNNTVILTISIIAAGALAGGD